MGQLMKSRKEQIHASRKELFPWSTEDERMAEGKVEVCPDCNAPFELNEQICEACREVHCEAYKPWVRGCNFKGECAFRDACPW